MEARQIEFSAAIWREGTFIKTHLHCGIREGAIGGICLAGNKACWAATIVGCYNCGALQLWGTATQYSSGALQLWAATNLWGATIGSASSANLEDAALLQSDTGCCEKSVESK